MVNARCTAAALTLGTLLACSADPAARPRTELVLLADTDIAELTHVEFEVRGEGRATELRRAPVRGDGAALSLGLVRTTGPLGPISASARGLAGDTELVARHVVVSFVEGRTLVVPLHLLRDCVGVACGAVESCTESGCAPRELPPRNLAEWPSLPPDIVVGEPPLEAGTTGDAALEAGLDPYDAGEADAGVEVHDGSALDAALDDAALDDAALDDAALDDAATLLDADVDGATDAQSEAATDAASDAGASCPGVDLTSDPSHCGTCTTVCTPSYIYLYHDVPACRNGVCTWACAPGYADCNGIQVPFIDRCEVYLPTDVNNCGGCGVKCKSTETCTSGTCKTKPT